MCSVVFSSMWLCGNVSDFLKVVLGCCAGRLGCFTLLKFFELTCFRLFWVVQVANVAFLFFGCFRRRNKY